MDANAAIHDFRHIITTQYFHFEGRTRRESFWHYVIACIALYILAYFLDSILGFGSSIHPVSTLLALGLLLPTLGILVRRLQDIGRNGFWVLIGFIPILGWALLIYWYAQPGTTGENEFGPDPNAPAGPVRAQRRPMS